MPMNCLPCSTMKWAIEVVERYIPERNDSVFLDFEPIKGKVAGAATDNVDQRRRREAIRLPLR